MSRILIPTKAYIPRTNFKYLRLHYNRRSDGHRAWKIGPKIAYEYKTTFETIFGSGFYSVGYYGKSDRLMATIGPQYAEEGSTILCDWDGSVTLDV